MNTVAFVVWLLLPSLLVSGVHVVRIATTGPGTINIAEIEFFNHGIPVPTSKVTAELSSTFHQYDAKQCIDGSLITFCHSNSMLNEPAWLHLTVDAIFDHIILHNRRDCCIERIMNATIEVSNDLGLRWQTQITDEKNSYFLNPKLTVFHSEYDRDWIAIEQKPVLESSVDLYGQSKYHFEMYARKKNESMKLSKTLPIVVPGNVREQVVAYCTELELPGSICDQLQRHYTQMFEEGHVNNDQFIDTCKTNAASSGSDGCGIEEDKENCSDYGCRRNGIKVAIVHLATAKAHWSATHAQAINLFYARRHSYDFISLACPSSISDPYMWDDHDQVRANWAKPNIILEHLERYHYVMMLDSDAYVMDPSLTIESLVEVYMKNFSIIVPNNCLAGTEGSFQSWQCWSKGLNIGAMIVKRTDASMEMMRQWSNAVTNDCRHLIFPQWLKRWMANDQHCLDLLFQGRTLFADHIHVLKDLDTFHFIGGANTAFLKHWFGGNNVGFGDLIRNDLATVIDQNSHDYPLRGTKDRKWIKRSEPVFGGEHLGPCFDVCIVKGTDVFHYQKADDDNDDSILKNSSIPPYVMYFSWRTVGSIGMITSDDGIQFSPPKLVVPGHRHLNNPELQEWESDVSRPHVLRVGRTLHMWYTGKDVTGKSSRSMIGHTTSIDGITWERNPNPVLVATYPWENDSVMCPFVLYEESKRIYRMWYSAGDSYEPLAIGHAISCDGIHWNKTQTTPVFIADSSFHWESHRVAGPAVVYNGEYYYLFYIGFGANVHQAAIGLSRSKNGISNWERHPRNPLITPSSDSWDEDAVYKPFPIFDGKSWLLYYNGRRSDLEQIGLAFLDGHDLWSASSIIDSGSNRTPIIPV